MGVRGLRVLELRLPDFAVNDKGGAWFRVRLVWSETEWHNVRFEEDILS